MVVYGGFIGGLMVVLYAFYYAFIFSLIEFFMNIFGLLRILFKFIVFIEGLWADMIIIGLLATSPHQTIITLSP